MLLCTEQKKRNVPFLRNVSVSEPLDWIREALKAPLRKRTSWPIEPSFQTKRTLAPLWIVTLDGVKRMFCSVTVFVEAAPATPVVAAASGVIVIAAKAAIGMSLRLVISCSTALFEQCYLMNFVLPTTLSVAASDLGTSKDFGAPSAALMLRIQPAWRASTVAIVAAACRVPGTKMCLT